MQFQFNDERSRRQIYKAICYANDTRAQNNRQLIAYLEKKARVAAGRDEWELVQFEEPSHEVA